MARRPSYALSLQRESFRHEPFKLGENSIRLFQVQEGDRNHPVRLGITQFSRERRPPYRAISYTWGSPLNLQEITVNGRAFRIHSNLWNLLFHLRLRKTTAFLWADAICIDQANLRERNFHVQRMGRIYYEAQSVIVWLGLPSIDRTELHAVTFVQQATFFRKSHGDAKFLETFSKPDQRYRWETLLHLCAHSYWTRTWIVQEFLRAPELEVICGTASIDWDQFESLLLVIQNGMPFQLKEIGLQILQSRPARLTLRRRARTESNLHELLQEYHDSTCTEKRDKVYGILGLASDCVEDEATGQARGMVPDYNKHIVEVYLDAVACVEKSLISPKSLPSAAYLVRQTLLLSDKDFADYARSYTPTQDSFVRMTVFPDYVGTVDLVLPSWTSIRDLKAQLDSIELGQYVGWEVKPVRPSLGRRSSSRTVLSSVPSDMFDKMIKVAEGEPELLRLYNYPRSRHLTVAPEHISLHAEDKRSYDNATLQKPCVILEYNQASDTIRLGFACTNAKRGDLIFQFGGLDVTLLGRWVGRDIVLVGKAVMIKHCELQYERDVNVMPFEPPWLSPCLKSQNPEMIELETNAISLAELLARS